MEGPMVHGDTDRTLRTVSQDVDRPAGLEKTAFVMLKMNGGRENT